MSLEQRVKDDLSMKIKKLFRIVLTAIRFEKFAFVISIDVERKIANLFRAIKDRFDTKRDDRLQNSREAQRRAAVRHRKEV
jgi:hypothetical protein